jgi:hypothetical protein
MLQTYCPSTQVKWLYTESTNRHKYRVRICDRDIGRHFFNIVAATLRFMSPLDTAVVIELGMQHFS